MFWCLYTASHSRFFLFTRAVNSVRPYPFLQNFPAECSISRAIDPQRASVDHHVSPRDGRPDQNLDGSLPIWMEAPPSMESESFLVGIAPDTALLAHSGLRASWAQRAILSRTELPFECPNQGPFERERHGKISLGRNAESNDRTGVRDREERVTTSQAEVREQQFRSDPHHHPPSRRQSVGRSLGVTNHRRDGG